MKAFRLVLITSFIALVSYSAYAQVKIGENRLQSSPLHWLEIDKTDSLFIVTDDLSMGLTNNGHRGVTPLSPNTDAIMLKLYGYGFGNFIPSGSAPYIQDSLTVAGVRTNIFAGFTDDGYLMEVPLRLVLEIQDSTVADLSFNNGVDTFGTTNLLLLDSIFATDNALRDSSSILRTLINNVDQGDGDTTTGNEYIDTITLSNDTLYFTENRDAVQGATNIQSVDLGPLIDATTFYLADGSFDEDRTVTGGDFNLVFNDVDTLDFSSTNFVAIDGNQVTIQQDGQDVILVNGNQDVKFRSLTQDSIFVLDSSGTLHAAAYGDTMITGTFTTILGVDADGNIIEVQANDIANTETDSTIYTHDGTLTGTRTLTGNSEDLTFTGLGTFNQSATTLDLDANTILDIDAPDVTI